MNDADRQRLNDAIRDVHDFPKPGIVFKDITPVLGDGELFRLAIDGLIEMAGGARIDKIVGVDARGFIFGAAAAHKLGIGFVPVRKKGKLPWQTHGCAYSQEHGETEIEIHKDAIGRFWPRGTPKDCDQIDLALRTLTRLRWEEKCFLSGG